VSSSVVPSPLRKAAKAGLRRWGMVTAASRPLPDYLLIGTKRGGSTSMAEYLMRHPGVAPLFPSRAVPKGVRYFDDHFTLGERWYRSHFATAHARAGRLAGEATAHYPFDPRAPGRAAATVPDAKIIVLLRDPVARAFSHWREQTRLGGETLSFEGALEAEPRRLEGETERLLADPSYVSQAREHRSYRAQGCYADLLPTWMSEFPPERMLILFSDDMYANPAATYEIVLDFLGLSPHDLRTYVARNKRPLERPMDPDTKAQLTAYFEPFDRRLEALLGRPVPWRQPRP
jgi:Sulfotransferase domain